MFCTDCGHQLPDAARYCPSCGRKVPGAVAQPRASQSFEDLCVRVGAAAGRAVRNVPWRTAASIGLGFVFSMELLNGRHYMGGGSSVTTIVCAVLAISLAATRAWHLSIGAFVAWLSSALVYLLAGVRAPMFAAFTDAVSGQLFLLVIYHVFALVALTLDVAGQMRLHRLGSGLALGMAGLLLFMAWPVSSQIMEQVRRMGRLSSVESSVNDAFGPYSEVAYVMYPSTGTEATASLVFRAPKVVVDERGRIRVTHEAIIQGRTYRAEQDVPTGSVQIPAYLVYSGDAGSWQVELIGADSIVLKDLGRAQEASVWIAERADRYLMREKQLRAAVLADSIQAHHRFQKLSDSLTRLRDTLVGHYLGPVVGSQDDHRFTVRIDGREQNLVLAVPRSASLDSTWKKHACSTCPWTLYVEPKWARTQGGAIVRTGDQLVGWSVAPTTMPDAGADERKPMGSNPRPKQDAALLHWLQEVDNEPELPGTFGDYLLREQRYPPEDEAAGNVGTVMVEFTVETDGRVTDVKLYNNGMGSTGTEAMKQEAMRLVAGSGPWIPAQKSGSIVRCRTVKKIRFDL